MSRQNVIPNQPDVTGFFLSAVGKQRIWRKPTRTWEEHANCTQKRSKLGYKPVGTFRQLWASTSLSAKYVDICLCLYYFKKINSCTLLKYCSIRCDPGDRRSRLGLYASPPLPSNDGRQWLSDGWRLWRSPSVSGNMHRPSDPRPLRCPSPPHPGVV